MKALAIDLGGTHATCAVVEDRSILASEVVATDGTAGLRPVLPEIVRAFHRLLAHTGINTSRLSRVLPLVSARSSTRGPADSLHESKI